MAVTNDVSQGTLTGSGTVDTVRTGANSAEQVTALFRNDSGGNRTVTVYVNGTAAANVICIVSLGDQEWFTIGIGLGNGDTLRAEASAATSINWTVSEVINP